MSFKSELLTPGEPTRRVVIELPESRALALSRVLNEHVDWDETEAGDELFELHEALGGDWRHRDEFIAQQNKAEA